MANRTLTSFNAGGDQWGFLGGNITIANGRITVNNIGMAAPTSTPSDISNVTARLLFYPGVPAFNMTVTVSGTQLFANGSIPLTPDLVGKRIQGIAFNYNYFNSEKAAGINANETTAATIIASDINTAPTTPNTISASGSFEVGESINVSWATSTDAEGDPITYQLEVSRNGESYAHFTETTARNASYVIPNATTSLRFRVRALSNGLTSNYATTVVYTVTNNSAPFLTVATTDNRTLYENDQFSVTGQVTDADVGNVVITKFSINGGTERAITSAISQGTAVTYNKVLTFKQGKLFDGANAVTDTLADGSQHVLRVWAEDDKGGKSAEQVRVFYVVANRSAVLTINPVTSVSDLIDSDTIAISGNVSDPDGNTVTVRYKVGNGLYTQVYSGTGGTFNFNVAIADLQTGVNTVMVQATDSYGLSTTKTLRVTKSANSKPLLKSVATYKLTPPNGSADGIVLWVQRETGDLIVNAEISMGANGAEENFVPMTKDSTAYVTDAIEEDEFTYDNGTAAENIIVRLTMERTSASSDKTIKLISGVLS